MRDHARRPSRYSCPYLSIQPRQQKRDFSSTVLVLSSGILDTGTYRSVAKCSLGGYGTEKCQNLIALSPSAHPYWDRCLFTLEPRPSSADMKTMELELFLASCNQKGGSSHTNASHDPPGPPVGYAIDLTLCETYEWLYRSSS